MAKNSLKTVAYDYIKENIIAYNLKPGDPILEQEIADKLNISRTPIREALKILDAEGFVTIYPFQGSFVSQLSESDIEDLLELRVFLEIWALKRSLYLITEEELDIVEAQFKDAYEKNIWELHRKADKDLHDLIVGKGVNKWARNVFASIKDQLNRVRNVPYNMIYHETSLKEHMGIISAIRKRDFQLAETALSEHLHQVKLRYLESY